MPHLNGMEAAQKIRGLDKEVAVSYTHLDVYKRQLPDDLHLKHFCHRIKKSGNRF